MVQLLLTRSSAQNKLLLGKLKRPDLPSFDLPLLEAQTIALSPEMQSRVMDLDQFDQLIFISKNAVEFGYPVLEQYWPQWPLKLSWLAVGKATAAALQQYDIDPIFPELASSEGLLELPQLQDVEEQRILIVRGIGGRETLKTELDKRGAKVDYLEVYERHLIPHKPQDLPDADQVLALVYSGEAIQRLHELVIHRHQHYTLVVPSERLRTLAIDTGFDKVEVAKSQEEDSMVEVAIRVLEQI